MIKRLRLLIAGFMALFVVGVAAPALAYDLVPSCNDHSDAAICPEVESDTNTIYGPDGIITKVAKIIAIIVGVASVIIIIVSGIQYMTSSGDPATVNKAKDAIIYALVGLAVAVIAQVVIVFFVGKLK